MIVKSAEFIKSATRPGHYPEVSHPEIAFLGRSNVGKSSLINKMLNRKRLARTSSTPGRTQLINFFLINDNIMFVDLPGYGYAKVPKNIQKSWQKMIETYLTTRPQLKGVILILDLRRNPSQNDLDLIRWLKHYHIPILIVLTKADKLKKSKQILQQNLNGDEIGIPSDELIVFSAKTGQGLINVWQRTENLIYDESKI